MFKKGQKIRLTVMESGSSNEYFNCTVIDYADGLLKIRDAAGDEAIYNVHSTSFIKATPEK